MMLETSQAFAALNSEDHSHILTLSESLLNTSPQAVPEFIKACPQLIERVTMTQLEKWFEEGIRVLNQNPDGGLAYFKLESAHAEESLETLSSGVEYVRIRDIMEMYCRGLAGEEIKLAETAELVGKNIGWVSNEAPSTEGSTVYLPTLVDRYTSKNENFAWFKVVSTHQVAHLEFGSFFFEFERPSSLFKDMRADLEGQKVKKSPDGQGLEDVNAGGLERAWVTDMQRYFNMFEDRKLALDIFTVIEDGRLDARVKVEYPGIRRSYTHIQADSLENRPEIQELP
ncbi:MAG: hypothetical protein ACRDIB_11650, partial [Ardenticatenaceae bacterium]